MRIDYLHLQKYQLPQPIDTKQIILWHEPHPSPSCSNLAQLDTYSDASWPQPTGTATHKYALIMNQYWVPKGRNIILSSITLLDLCGSLTLSCLLRNVIYDLYLSLLINVHHRLYLHLLFYTHLNLHFLAYLTPMIILIHVL